MEADRKTIFELRARFQGQLSDGLIDTIDRFFYEHAYYILRVASSQLRGLDWKDYFHQLVKWDILLNNPGSSENWKRVIERARTS